MHKLLIVGCGHMGQALLKGLIKNKNTEISVVDPTFSHNEITVYKTAQDLPKGMIFDTIIFATRVSVFPQIAPKYLSYINENTNIISVMAGVKIETIQTYFREQKIFRLMPNLAVAFDEGCTTGYSYEKNKQEVTKLIEESGSFLWLDEEDDIDILTPLNGSGPGLLFAFCDALARPYVEMGYNKKMIERMLAQTMLGSSLIFNSDMHSFEDLKNAVATKGGVTEAALLKLEPELYNISKNAIISAIKKVKNEG